MYKMYVTQDVGDRDAEYIIIILTVFRRYSMNVLAVRP